MIGRTTAAGRPQRVHRGGSILLDHVVHGLLLQLPKPAASSRVARQFCQCCGNFGRCSVSVPRGGDGGRAGELRGCWLRGNPYEGVPHKIRPNGVFGKWERCFLSEATTTVREQGLPAIHALTHSVLRVVTALDAEIGFGRPTTGRAFLSLGCYPPIALATTATSTFTACWI